MRTKTSFWEFGDHLGGLLTVVGLGLVVATLNVAWTNRQTLPHPAVPLGGIALVLFLRLAVEVDDRLETALTGMLVLALAIVLATAAWLAAKEGRRSVFNALGKAACALAVVGAVGAVVSGRPVLATGLAFAGPCAAIWLTARSRSVAFAAALVAAATSIVAGAELVYVVDDLSGGDAYRMNTIFKFYNQVWILLALSGACLVAIMLERTWTARPWRAWQSASGHAAATGLIARLSPAVTRSAAAEQSDRRSRLADQWAVAGVALTALVIAVSLFYPLLATRPRLEQRFTDNLGSGTLNALDWMDYGTITTARGEVVTFDGDRAAIDWFNTHVDGTPVIAEAGLPPYRGNGSRISIATGLPTVLGWDRHQNQQRYPEGIGQRNGDVRTLYDSPDPSLKEQLLRRYGVAYVVVGDVERLSMIGESTPYASPEGIVAFEEMVGTVLEVAFESGGTVVYRVLPPSHDN